MSVGTVSDAAALICMGYIIENSIISDGVFFCLHPHQPGNQFREIPFVFSQTVQPYCDAKKRQFVPLTNALF